jgi:ligand-binding sensor domain-containing protein/signal transduction histidine kinase/CheY-like chemotaxis protein
MGQAVFFYALDPGKAITQYIRDTWTVKDGLPQNTIFSISQTHDGYIWIGTTNGLARFDGVTFRTFNKQNTPELKNNKIFALCKSRDQNLWIGTGGGGLVCLKDGAFKNYSTNDGLAHDGIRAIFEDKEGCLWIGTDNGLCRFKEGTFTTYTTKAGLSNNSVRAICQDGEGSLWVGTAGGGLNRFKDGTFKSYGSGEGLTHKYIRVIHYDKEGRLRVGTVGGGLFILENDRFKAIATNEPGANGNIYSLYEDRNGGLWVGTSRGIRRLKNGAPANYHLPVSLHINDVLFIYEDREGSLWIGSYDDGLHRLKDARFTCYTREEGLSSDDVVSVYEDKSGTLWLGTAKWLSRLENGIFNSLPPVKGGTAPAVLAIGEDRDGGLWFGTMGQGLFHLKNGTYLSYTQKDGLSHNWIRTITGANDGGIWVGTNGGGLNYFKNGTFTAYTTKDGLSNDTVYSILQDGPGTLWIGTNDGLNRLKDGVFTVYKKKDGLSDNTVLTIYRDSEETLWIGANEGLNHFKDGVFTAYTVKEGLKNDSIYQILEDRNKNLWMLCGNGVLRVNKRQLEKFKQGKINTIRSVLYGRADGMKSTQSNQGGTQPAAWKSKDGKLWFTTAKGVVMTDPNQMNLNTLPPPVLIEKVDADGIIIKPGAGNPGNKNPGIKDEPVVFSPGKERFEFHYTALSFLVPERVKFKYILEGYDPGWRDGGTSRAAFYMNIPSGEYCFRVMACNNDGLWNTTGASFTFYLKAYVYQTWWFYLFCGVGLVFLSFGAYRWRVKRLKRREEELEILVARRTGQLARATEMADAASQAKSQFLAHMSHEIRTPLNSIIGFSDLLMESGLDGEKADFADTINRSGEALLTIINDVLDLSKIEAGIISFEAVDFNVSGMASEVCESIQPKVRDRRVQVNFRVSPEVPATVKQDAGRFRQVLVNLMANAAKFTEKGDIRLSIGVEEEDNNRLKLHCSVRDTGIGIPPGKLDSIFEAFHQADGSITRKYGGTGLGLPICRQIAKHMGGDIRVESTQGKGSVFHFTAWVEKSTQDPDIKPGPQNQRSIGDPLQPPGSLDILLAEDNAINRKLALYMFRKTRHRLEVVENGKQAVETYTTDPGKYDLILMDIRMPEMDGLQATREIRGQGYKDIPIIAMTAQSMKGDRQKCLDAGMNDYITKPIKSELIFEAIEKWVLKR